MEDFKYLLDAISTTIPIINATESRDADDMPSYITERDLITAYSVFDKRYTPFGTEPFGCYPVREEYYCIIHKDILFDLQSINGFITRDNYPSGLPDMSDDEVGAIFNIRFIALDDPRLLIDCRSCNDKDVYACILFEKDHCAADDAVNLRVTKYISPHN